jgi:DNA (cytosine-5)-methyltransferase 1
MNELALFAGAGGGILGGHLLGWRTVCAVEIEDYPRRVLLARQRDGLLPRFPIWDDITTFDGYPWSGRVDVVSGGFPCQDISAAGKGAGISGSRSGLWAEMARVIGEVQPRFVFVENSPVLTSRGLDVVLGDLATLGYDARWGVLGACHAGGNIQRKRIWILAKPRMSGQQTRHSAAQGRTDPPLEKEPRRSGRECIRTRVREWIETESGVCGVAYGMADRVDRLNAIGNGQVPAVARLAWRILTEQSQQPYDTPLNINERINR